jgi:NTE family protein
VQGFVKGEKVFKAMEEFIGDHQIENLRIPFTAVAADLFNKKEVHYRTGSLFKALRASIAIPTVFTPVINGRSQLVDGGVLNPLPINLVRKEEGEIMVAVNLNANIPYGVGNLVVEKAAYLKMLDAIRSTLPRSENKNESTVENLGLFDILNKSYDLTQDRLTELMLEVHQPDIVVNISRDACGVFEFYRANEIIDEGRKAFHRAYVQYQTNSATL